jgi:hypothetical protein
VAFDHDVAPELTAAPADAELVPVSRGFREPRDVGAAAQFPLLAPTWLPANFTFDTGSARDDDDAFHASLIFSRDRREFVTVYQQPESQTVGEEVYESQRVERGPRAVMITDLGDKPGERIAHTTDLASCHSVAMHRTVGSILLAFNPPTGY